MTQATTRRVPRKSLVALVGAVVAGMLMTAMPAEESGRTVTATVQPSGDITLRHVRGPQHLRAYLDIVQVPTICDGITRGVKIGQSATEAECAARLEIELIEHAEGVQRCTPQLWEPGRERILFAAVSLAYNIGVPRYCASTAARRFQARSWRAGCDAIPMWNKAGGRVVQGLVNRRARERAACLQGVPA